MELANFNQRRVKKDKQTEGKKKQTEEKEGLGHGTKANLEGTSGDFAQTVNVLLLFKTLTALMHGHEKNRRRIRLCSSRSKENKKRDRWIHRPMEQNDWTF